MPYTIQDPPDTIKNIPKEAQRLWINAFNSALEKDQSEDDARKAGWGAVKNKFKKEGDNWVKKTTQASEGNRFTYLEDLGILCKDNKYPEKIQLLRVGEWKHPMYGEFKVSKADLKKFKENYDAKVRKIELALDAEHYPEKGAAAWFRELTIEGDALFAIVEWTDWGKEVIDKKLFRYISPEFDFEYEDFETGDTHKNVLFGAALTNRPFIKNMQPVLMSENIDVKDEKIPLYKRVKTEKKGGQEMDLKKLSETLGLKEAKEEDILNKVKETMGDAQKFSEIKKDLELSEDASIEDITAKLKEIKEEGEGKVTLSEQEVKQLKESAKLGHEASTKLKEMEADKAVDGAMRVGKIAPKQKDWAKNYALSDAEGFKKFVENAPKVVEFKETGSQGEGEEETPKDEAGMRAKLNEKAEALLSEGKAKDYKSALELAEKEVKE